MAKSISKPLQYATICIDSYDDKIPVGRLRYAHLGREMPFRGLMQLLLLAQDAMQDEDFPAQYMQLRRFAPATETAAQTAAKNEEKSPPGRLATFCLKIFFRQNAGWQGTLAWLDSGQEQAFRSVLELAVLLDSALDGGTPL